LESIATMDRSASIRTRVMLDRVAEDWDRKG
jgi:hypothetical protein